MSTKLRRWARFVLDVVIVAACMLGIVTSTPAWAVASWSVALVMWMACMVFDYTPVGDQWAARIRHAYFRYRLRKLEEEDS